MALALVLSFSVVACNNGDTKKTEKTDKTEEKTEENSEKETEKPADKGDEEQDEKDPAKEEVKVDLDKNIFSAELDDYKGDGAKLIYHTIGGVPDDLQLVVDEMNKYTKEHMNVEVDIIFHPYGEYEDQMNLLINTSEEYDLAFGSAIAGVKDFINQDIFLDLNTVLDKAPNLKALIPDVMWQGVTRSNGEIFGVPAYKDVAAAQYWVIDKKFVDAYDLDVKNIADFADLTAVFEKVKANPEKMPEHLNEYPLYLDKGGINSFLFEFENIANGVGVKFGDTKAINVWADEDAKAKFKLMAEWYDAGYINPSANTDEGKEPNSDAIFSAQGWPEAAYGWGNGRPNGVEVNLRLEPMFTADTIMGSFLVISRASKHAEAAIKYIERLNVDKYLRNLYAYGIEGTHYEKTEKEDVILQTERGDKQYNVPSYTQGQFMNTYVKAAKVTEENADQYPDLKVGDAILDSANPGQWLSIHENNQNAETSKILGFTFDPEPVKTELTNLKAVLDKYEAELFTGAAGVEGLDALLEQIYAEQEAVGIQTVIDELQKQIDEYLKK